MKPSIGQSGSRSITIDEALDQVWQHLCVIADHEGASPLNQYPGLWECIAGKWRLLVNGKPTACALDGVSVPPYNAYLEFNGWPAGFIDPYSGTIAAGELANIFTLEEALAERVRQFPEARG